MQEDYCRATYWGALLTAPKEGCQRKRYGIAYILHEADVEQELEKEIVTLRERGSLVLTIRDQLTCGIMYWYEARSPNSHQTKNSVGTPRQEPLH